MVDTASTIVIGCTPTRRGRSLPAWHRNVASLRCGHGLLFLAGGTPMQRHPNQEIKNGTASKPGLAGDVPVSSTPPPPAIAQERTAPPGWLTAVTDLIRRVWLNGAVPRCPDCGGKLTLQDPFDGNVYSGLYAYRCPNDQYTWVRPDQEFWDNRG